MKQNRIKGNATEKGKEKPVFILGESIPKHLNAMKLRKKWTIAKYI